MHLLRFVLAYADRAGGKATKRERAEGETDAVEEKERRKGEEPRHNEGSECCKTACDDTAGSYKK